MRIDNKFNIGDHVFVVTDKEQDLGVITAIMVTQGDILYFVSRDCMEDKFYDYELSLEENKLIKL